MIFMTVNSNGEHNLPLAHPALVGDSSSSGQQINIGPYIQLQSLNSVIASSIPHANSASQSQYQRPFEISGDNMIPTPRSIGQEMRRNAGLILNQLQLEEEIKHQFAEKDSLVALLNSQIAALTTEKNTLNALVSNLASEVTAKKTEIENLKRKLEANESEINDLKEKDTLETVNSNILQSHMQDFKELNPSMNVYKDIKALLSYQETIAKEKFIPETIGEVQNSLREALQQKCGELYFKIREAMKAATKQRMDELDSQIKGTEISKVNWIDEQRRNKIFNESQIKEFVELYDKALLDAKETLSRFEQVKETLKKLHDAIDS